MKKTRTLLAAAAAIAGLVALTGPAQAAPPIDMRPQPLTQPLEGTDTAGNNGYCPFPVFIEGINNQLFHEGSNGNQFTGFISVNVTNVDTGKTQKFNISGPGTVTGAPDGSFTIDAKGHNLLWTTVANSQPAGVLQLAYTTGHVQVSVAADGRTTDYQLSGKSTDVCKLLAS